MKKELAKEMQEIKGKKTPLENLNTIWSSVKGGGGLEKTKSIIQRTDFLKNSTEIKKKG